MQSKLKRAGTGRRMKALFDWIVELFDDEREALRVVAVKDVLGKSLPGKRPMSNDPVVILDRICGEARRTRGKRNSAVKLSVSATWEMLKVAPKTLQIEVVLKAADPTHRPYFAEEVRKAIAVQLLRKELPFSEQQLAHLLDAWVGEFELRAGVPGLNVLAMIERELDGRAPDGVLRDALEVLWRHQTDAVEDGDESSATAIMLARVSALLAPGSADLRALPAGAFASSLVPWLEALEPAQRDAWRRLLTHAAGASGKSKPTANWMNEGATHVAAVGDGVVAARLVDWLDSTTPDPVRADASLDMLKGLLWLASAFGRDELASAVGRFTEKCFRKVSGSGIRSVRLGNAALWMLSEVRDSGSAASELFRLRAKLGRYSLSKLIDERLATIAEDIGTNVRSLEETALSDFGLAADGSLCRVFGDFTAIITLTATDVAMTWRRADGTTVKSAPAAVKRDWKAELAAIRQLARDIEDARASQILLLEQSWLDDRYWDVAEWRRNFLDHPLRRHIVEPLLWCFENGGDPTPLVGLPKTTALVTLSGEVALPESGMVRLWHPLESDPETVLAWRRHVEAERIVQPVKQAHREIYLLTDPERRTGTYSNRFAAHVLRQHQFHALCQARHWVTEVFGHWSLSSVPSRRLKHHDLTMQYHVKPIDNGKYSESGIPLHLATDRVCFVDARRKPVPLETVPPIVFSECLRDVDLFVAVASVANDPAWADGGPNGRFGGYWREWAFGELGQSAQTRRAIIASLAPGLAIADRLEITEKFLIVQGQRHKYAIHFGSGNVRILASNRDLCIVPGRTPKNAENITLPFAGDSLLPIILGRAFLLADESQITDPAILQQL